jgi:hypothetical protein
MLYDRVALDARPGTREFLVVRVGNCAAPAGYARVALPTRRLLLYRRDPG